MKRSLSALILIVIVSFMAAAISQAETAPTPGGFNYAIKLGVYTVQPGDTLWRIAERYRTTVVSLQDLNYLSGTMIYVGSQLTVPDRVTIQRISGAPAAQQPSQNQGAFAQEVFRLTNLERTKAGLAPFADDRALADVAQEKARDMQANGYFDHNSPTYGSPFEMMKRFGLTYSYAAENIAKGYTSPQSVVAGWMASSGHRANILDPNLTRLGVGVAGDIWVQMFRTP